MEVAISVVCYKSKMLSNGEYPLMVRVANDGYFIQSDAYFVQIRLSPKATQIMYHIQIDRCSQYVDGKKVNDYRFGDSIFDYRF